MGHKIAYNTTTSYKNNLNRTDFSSYFQRQNESYDTSLQNMEKKLIGRMIARFKCYGEPQITEDQFPTGKNNNGGLGFDGTFYPDIVYKLKSTKLVFKTSIFTSQNTQFGIFDGNEQIFRLTLNQKIKFTITGLYACANCRTFEEWLQIEERKSLKF